jgi:predicted MFS family arabinose efflux permease
MDHMTTQPDPNAAAVVADKRCSRAPWFPLIVIVLAQLQMAINVSALPVSLGPISEDLDVPATAAATALLFYSLFVAAFVMLGAKIGKLIGERRVFQASVVAHGVSTGLMATSTNASVMNTAQAIAGVAAAGLVPTLVVFLRVVQQARASRQAAAARDGGSG